MDKQIREHDAVVLLRDLPGEKLIAGDTGVVVYVYENDKAFEVEFPNPAAKPRFVVVTVQPSDVLKLQHRSRLKEAS